MAEKKYDLLLGPRRDSSLKIRHQPWYRERLNTKVDHKAHLVASSWTFIKDGLDDFRDGLPPIVDSSIIIKGNKGITPSLFGSDLFGRQNPKQRIHKHARKNDAVYSKRLPNQQKRQQKVEYMEKHLLNHPHTLFPHIEDSVSSDLLEDIVDLLDSSLLIADDNEFPEDDLQKIHAAEHGDRTLYAKSSRTMGLPNQACSGYTMAMKEKKKTSRRSNNKVIEDEPKKDEKARTIRRKSQLTKIEGVTKDFCDWVKDLGGTTNNIEETTINTLFASGYDTKPTLSVPVHVVELTNVPPELRADGCMMNYEENEVQDGQDTSYTPSWTKVKYGAWYLHPNTWKSRPSNEPLQDPKEIEGKQMSEARKKSKELDEVLSNLHGAKSFRAFIEKKGVRNPEFLEGVSTNDADPTIAKDTWKKRATSVVN